MRKLIVIAILSLAVAGALAAWKFSAAEGVSVTTAAVEEGPLSVFLIATGKVASGHEVKVTARSAGQVEAVYAKEGQRVAAGEVLARLDDKEVRAQMGKVEAALRLAQAEVAQVAQTVARFRRVVPSGLEPAYKLEDAEAQLKSAQAKEGVAAAELRLAHVALDNLNVTAPFAGLITLSPVRAGQWIVPPEALFTLADLERREIEVKIDADDSAGIAVGQEVTLSSDAFPGRQWSERVTRLAPSVEKEEAANTVNVYLSLGADIDNGAPPLRLGQQVDVKIRTAFRSKALKVPFAALISKDEKTWVAAIEQGRVKLLPVVTGIEDLTHTEILQGVSAGQQVILAEGKTLKEGDRVRVGARNPR